jgi:hypothetical protein
MNTQRTIAVLVLAPTVLLFLAIRAGANDEASFNQRVLPLVKTYCVECHGGNTAEADLSFDTVERASHVDDHPDLWEDVAKKLRRREMPPADHPQPSTDDLKAVDEWLEGRFAKLLKSRKPDPGRVTMRRLNRREYNNTIRDLAGVDFRPADGFPADDTGYGFDNIGDVLALSPLLVEKYLAAAEQIVDKAMIENHRIIPYPSTPAHRALLAKETINRFADRAFRRPASRDEVLCVYGLYQKTETSGATFEQAIRVALTAILVSPNFLFRIEIDKPSDGQDGSRDLNEFELASRLSYFLWSSMPDDELFDAARIRTLKQTDHLTKQVGRMLDDPKSSALVESFAVQWLQLGKLGMRASDTDRFPQFTPELRDDMRRETELFFQAVMREDRPITDLLDADFTFVNERLAKHYGIDSVQGNEFRRVNVSSDTRGGILTHASVLTLTSNPTRTSPVKRGKWVLETLLGTPPPPPPPGVPEVPGESEGELVGPLRQRLEQHRTASACSVCHSRIDPLGFGLENYDAIGRWRTHDALAPVDASGTLPDGRSFNGPGELKELLISHRDDFARALGEKMLTYALGRGLAASDRLAIDKIVARVKDNDYRFKSLVLAIVLSEPFLKRSTEELR